MKTLSVAPETTPQTRVSSPRGCPRARPQAGRLIVLLLGVGLLATCLSAFAAAQSNTITLYVATNGNDGWSGRRAAPNADATDGPLATFTGARDALRQLKTAGKLDAPARVLFRQGTYYITTPVVFEAEDSGGPQTPITYTAYPGETAVISGGRVIRNWEERRDGLWTVRLPEVRKAGWSFRQLFIKGQRRTLGRTPNSGEFELTGMGTPVTEAATGRPEGITRASFHFDDAQVKPWLYPRQIRFVAFDDTHVAVLQMAGLDTETNTVTLAGAPGWPFTQSGERLRVYIQNYFEAVDAPGEWYLDTKSGHLFYRPLPRERRGRTRAVALVAPQFLVFAGKPDESKFVEYLRFQGLKFHFCGYETGDGEVAGPPAAIQLTGARHCVIQGCEVAHIGTFGIVSEKGCEDNSLTQNRISDGRRQME